MIEKVIEIDGKKVKFRSSAAVTRKYRVMFGRDIFKDMKFLMDSIGAQTNPDQSTLDNVSLEIFENVSFVMAKQADPENVPDDPDEWLEQFGLFSIYMILPEIVDLWSLSNAGDSVPVKKVGGR